MLRRKDRIMNVKELKRLNTEKLTKWKDGQSTITLKPEDIIITEQVHMRAEKISFNSIMVKYLNKTEMDRIIVVRKPKHSDKYSLVMGVKWLMIAKLLNLSINCIVVKRGTTHKKLRSKLGLVDDNFKVPKGTESIYPISKVSVLKEFKDSKPRKEKYEKYEKHFTESGCIDKPITVVQNKNDKNAVVVVDEYIRYLFLVKNGIKYIPVRFKE
jgi:hypothetical protein